MGCESEVVQSPRRVSAGSLDFLVRPRARTKDEKESEQTENSSAKPKRFHALLAAKAKKQVVPLSIPGGASASPPPMSPSHPSHMQSVQASVAASWTNGRTEMWPLQLLDAADRQRAKASSAGAGAAKNNGAGPPRQGSVSSRQSSKVSPASAASASRLPPSGGVAGPKRTPVGSSAKPSPGTATYSSTKPNNISGPSPRSAQSRASATSTKPFLPPTQPPPGSSSSKSPASKETSDGNAGAKSTPKK